MSVPRTEPIMERGMEVPPSMGTAIAINFQPSGGGKAAITGDFVMTANWANDDASALAAGLRAALDQMKVKKVASK